jgi:hypothetical protein
MLRLINYYKSMKQLKKRSWTKRPMTMTFSPILLSEDTAIIPPPEIPHS